MQKTKEVRFAVSENGKCHIKEWLLGLDAQTRARIHVRLVRLQYGAYGDYKRIDNKISELRFFFPKGYRIYFTEKENKLILLLNGGDKMTFFTKRTNLNETGKLLRDVLIEELRNQGKLIEN
jgi:putative addiction module killer protein